MAKFKSLLRAGALALSLSTVALSSNFTYNSNSFLLDGKPFQIIGGQMDPQRIPRAYWRQRLQMARAMGLNTVFSYVFWNDVEPQPDQFNFEDRNDIAEYFRIAQEEDLYVVLRPGPYVCGEHSWGGFPAWLSQIPGMNVRANNGPFLDRSKIFLDQLGHQLKGLLITEGGPILMAQVENEYGFSGRDDPSYLTALAALVKANFDITLYTNDGGSVGALETGHIPGILAETDGDPHDGFAARSQLPDATSQGPQMDGEYYVTTAPRWGSDFQFTTVSDNSTLEANVISDLSWVLGGNNSFSIYMFHGGTNWGLENGGIGGDNNNLAAFATTYDYGAPLDESGRTTDIYNKLRNMISNYVPEGSIPDVPSTPNIASVPQFELKPVMGLFNSLHRQPSTSSITPLDMEALGQDLGFVLYEHRATDDVSGVLSPGDQPRDRVIVYVNGARVGVIDAVQPPPRNLTVSLKAGELLQLLVEDLGRIDIGAIWDQRKGIVGNVTIGNSGPLENWSIHSIPFTTAPSTGKQCRDIGPFQSNSPPVYFKGSFEIPHGSTTYLQSDTFLSLPAGIKGLVWVNGILLGRYWTIGPQQSLYLPGAYLKPAGRKNDVLVLELEPQGGKPFVAEGISQRKWFNNPDPDAL